MKQLDSVMVFVHGCTQGPSGWDRVRELLTESGLHSLTVDLAPEEFDAATALECAAHISLMTEGHERVVVIGTSCSGILTPVVTVLREVERLVLVCAGLPDPGRSVTEQIAHDGVLHDDWRNWTGAPDSPEAATRFMFNDCAAADLQWSLGTVRLFIPRPAYDEVTPLSAWPSVPSTYILGTQDRIISQDWARRVVPTRIGSPPIEIPTGHCPQNSQPALLAQLLTKIVGQPADEASA
jgi:pimeloyl-ACP methyl ester carboxylesterase